MNVPDPVPIIDGFIAATAKVHDLTFVTRDTGQFEQRGVRVLNPFIPLETP
jgi:predicted nucleic acid-binding protein